jgi:hypothetical protein
MCDESPYNDKKIHLTNTKTITEALELPQIALNHLTYKLL